MTDVKGLLDEASPLPWAVHDGAIITMLPDDRREVDYDADLALIVHAVNHLSDYEAVVAALERLLATLHALETVQPTTTVVGYETDDVMAVHEACAALNCLRDGLVRGHLGVQGPDTPSEEGTDEA